MKDPYVFDFIPFREDMLERDIEQALVRDVTKLLLEFGTGFAFWGNQYHLNVGGDDFYTFCGQHYAKINQLMPESKNLYRLTKPEISRKTKKCEVMQL